MSNAWKVAGLVLLIAAATAGGFVAYRYVTRKVELVGPSVPVGPTVVREAIAVPEVRFTDVTKVAGIGFTHFSGATGSKLLPETMGAGVCVIDYDNDGRPDLFFANGRAWPGHPLPDPAATQKLYRNAGDGTFTDVTKAVGLDVTFYGMGACAGDFDNDGFTDLFVTGIGGHRLFRNAGGKRFEDVTATAGVAGPGKLPDVKAAADFLQHAPPIPFGTSATFVDYDGDAKLDLFVCHYCTWSPAIDLSIESTLTGVGRTYQQPTSLEGNQCSLYRNNGDGTFTDASAAAGVLVFDADGAGANAKQRPVGKSLGVIAFDPDGDGWPDLLVANDTVRNFLFHNVPDGKGGRKFAEVGLQSNVAYAEATARGAMGVDSAEYKPGKPAVLITNFANEPDTFLTITSPSRLLFADSCAAVSLLGPSRGPLKFGTFFFDYDLDGRPDILTANGHIDPDISTIQANQTYRQAAQLFWNTGDAARVFEPITSAASGPDLFKPVVGRGCAYFDFDLDGDPDVIITENGGPPLLLRNDQKTGHHWLRLTLKGDGVASNRSAIGATVTVTEGGKTLTRTVAGARGYLSQSELAVGFGLGDAAKVESVTVRWPGRDAKPQTWTNLKADAAYTLTQGKPAAVTSPR
jgi:hypothetical protein